MGLVLGAGAFIAAEREHRPVSGLLSSLQAGHSETKFPLSSITVMELEHGLCRADTFEAAASELLMRLWKPRSPRRMEVAS